MSVNKERPHILVVPEDDANRQLANGFVLELDPAVARRIQVLVEVGGWLEVLNCFERDDIAGLERYIERNLILLIGFDRDENRLNHAKERVPERLKERVFVIGAWSEPAELKRAGLGTYETMGRDIAKDCRQNTEITWGHELLRNNAGELHRLLARVRPILFA